MASGPDLFVVCKSCGSEVSPYITECPYCGTRLRKRAPKLERGGKPKAPRRPRPRLAPLRRGEIPGIRPDRRPYATIALVVVLRDRLPALARGREPRSATWSLLGPLDGDWWRPITTQFVYDSTGYEVAALAAVALFGVAARAPPRLVGAARRVPDRRHGRDGGRRRGRSPISPWAATPARSRCWPPGRCATCSAGAAGARTTPTCSARSPSPSCSCCSRWPRREANALAGLVGGVAGILMGLGLARLRER